MARIAPSSELVAARLTVSRTPSPLGENQGAGSAPGVTLDRCGGAVSTMTVRVELAGALPHASTPVTVTV